MWIVSHHDIAFCQVMGITEQEFTDIEKAKEWINILIRNKCTFSVAYRR